MFYVGLDIHSKLMDVGPTRARLLPATFSNVDDGGFMAMTFRRIKYLDECCFLALQGASAEIHFYVVVDTVVDQQYGLVRLVATVGGNPLHGPAGTAVADGNVVEGFAITVVNFHRRPGGGQAWSEVESVDVEMQARERFGERAVHPAGRAGV